ncbi:hypothetical protein PY093_05190, partial [Cytobacillus sp. S13-E01]|uniref:hypothetical protein n=1 Tax=Cytobacillus sp. S13-E01 TaxID=3031326 RepID=UPI0023D8206E
NEPSDFTKSLKKIREHHTPLHTIEVEIEATKLQSWKLLRISEHLRLIRNTVLGQVYKNYQQMIRTKEYRMALRTYKKVSEELVKVACQKEIKKLESLKNEAKKGFDELRSKYQVTFDFVRNYGTYLRDTKYHLPDAVTVWSVCEMVWSSIERIMYGEAGKPRFYKKRDFVTLQGKQAERCIILKHDSKKETFHISHNGMKLPLIIKKRDLFIQETLSHVVNYMNVGSQIDKENVERHEMGKAINSTYRIRNNRIVIKEIHGKLRFYVQIVLEGTPVVKRKKDGSFRHTYGVGRLGVDIGTQSIAIVSLHEVKLKNLAERSHKVFNIERNVGLENRYLSRSRRATNPKNYNKDGTIKKGKKKWVKSKRYDKRQKKLKELQRRTALSRKYAHNEEVNTLRSLGDELFIETMNIKGLQKKAKSVTKNEKTGKFNKRKRFGKSIGKRSPGYFIKQAKYRFLITEGSVHEVNTWKYKASQYDHIINDINKKQLSKRWHELPNGLKIQRDLYSAFLLYCSEDTLEKPNRNKCLQEFNSFYDKHQHCIEQIRNNHVVVLNSGIKINKVVS